MPRRGSRAQLVHLLAKEDALNHAWLSGPLLPAAAFYEDYSHYSRGHLEELVAYMRLEPRRRGRPKSFHNDADLVVEVKRRLAQPGRASERRVCERVAEAWSANPNVVRMRYRRATAAR